MKVLISALFSFLLLQAHAQISTKLEPIDVFDMEFVSGPQISPNGKYIVYSRNYKDIMTDRNLSNLWIINADGSNNRPLTMGKHSHGGAVWAPDGEHLYYRSDKEGSSQVYLLNPQTRVEVKITDTPRSPGGINPSPDGKWLSFTMSVDFDKKPFAKMPPKPKGAKWNDPPLVIDKMQYRRDGSGYVPDHYSQIFIVSARGGTPIQLTFGEYNHGGAMSWSKDSKYIFYSANAHDDRQQNPNNSEIYRLAIADGSIEQLTDRFGPDGSPQVSPDGESIAYLGFDDQLLGYQQARLYIMDKNGDNKRCLSCDTDFSLGNLTWADDSKSLYYQYDQKGQTFVGHITLQGENKQVAKDLGGTTLGRPYSSGSYSISDEGTIAFTYSQPTRPAELAVQVGNSDPNILTDVNGDLFHFKKAGKVEEIWYKSSADGRDIHGWICYPPDFDASKKYPLILEIHGGPFANYGPRFSGEVQLYAAAGYVVLYTNPRGSSSYGAEFGNTIHHNYPSQDYDDLISGVDEVIARGFIDEDRLYVTGGSGGGVLTSWIVGKTDRFRAAVVAKPVINWYSFVLYADAPAFFAKYWFGEMPWENPMAYHRRSPISLVGNVTTPTMLLTGESDFRTPMPETEQYYAALKLQGVDTKMVRIPGAGHGIAARPSNLIAKVVYILEWFETYK